MRAVASKIMLVLFGVVGVAASDTALAAGFACGPGTPKASSGKCECPTGMHEKTQGGISKCEANPAAAQCAVGLKKDASGKCIPITTTTAPKPATPSCPTGSSWVVGTGCVGTVSCPAPAHFVAGVGCVSDGTLPQLCAQVAGKADFGGLAPGSRVVLGKHRAVDGDEFWASEMAPYVGLTTTVRKLSDVDSQGCPILQVEADSVMYYWRVRDLKVAPATYPQACGQKAPKIDYGVSVGWKVVLGKHRPVEGVDFWSSSMDADVGKTSEVLELSGVDEQGCPLVRVDADKKVHQWRVRDLAPATALQAAPAVAATPAASSGSEFEQACDQKAGSVTYGLGVGTSVILGRHRKVDGKDNWASGMDAYVGKPATVVELHDVDAAGCAVVRVDADSKSYYWRVRDMKPAGDFVQACGLKGVASDFGTLKVGDSVILGRHRAVDGEEDWATEMAAYVGKPAKVTKLDSADVQGCPYARVDTDGGSWAWRIRDLKRGSGSASSAGYSSGKSSGEWPMGSTYTVGIWSYERTAEGRSAHIYAFGGSSAVELIGSSNGWFRLRKGTTEKVVFSPKSMSPQPFEEKPWKSSPLASATAAGTVWKMTSGDKTTTLAISATGWHVTLSNGEAVTGDSDGVIKLNGKIL